MRKYMVAFLGINNFYTNISSMGIVVAAGHAKAGSQSIRIYCKFLALWDVILVSNLLDSINKSTVQTYICIIKNTCPYVSINNKRIRL